ncbi:MAG TPA: MGMT family protein [bacterium]|nr:MGMT family protein [bacterium]
MSTTGDSIRMILGAVPHGKVASYSGIAMLAGIPNGARTVARLLHSCSSSDGLPWWRIVRADGSIALEPGFGFEEQAARLRDEGVLVDARGRIDLSEYGWLGPVSRSS